MDLDIDIPLDMSEVRQAARDEIKKEKFDEAVVKYKAKLKEQKLWDKLFPWRLIIVRKD